MLVHDPCWTKHLDSWMLRKPFMLTSVTPWHLSISIFQLGGGFKYFFAFTPTWGRFPCWLIIFRMGWFNHQPDKKSTIHVGKYIPVPYGSYDGYGTVFFPVVFLGKNPSHPEMAQEIFVDFNGAPILLAVRSDRRLSVLGAPGDVPKILPEKKTPWENYTWMSMVLSNWVITPI